MSLQLAEQLDRGLSVLALDLPPTRRLSLLAYLELLTKWNKVHNLTAIREPERMVSHHLLDSLAVLPWIAGARVADIGSGGGLPGIPLAIANPDWQVTLLDSNHKKATFLREAKAQLKLDNVAVVCERVEQYRPAQAYDVVISRAFSDLAEFARLTRHLLVPGGILAAMKGVHPYEELAQLPAELAATHIIPLTVPELDAERHLVLLAPQDA